MEITIEEFVKKTHAVICEEGYIQIHIPVCSKREHEEYEQFAKTRKYEILKYLGEQEQLEERKARLERKAVAVHAVEKAWERYEYALREFLHSNGKKPVMPKITVKDAVAKLNFREHAYLLADRYARSDNFDQAAFGEQAKLEIAKSNSSLPETYQDIIREMKEKWLNFCKEYKPKPTVYSGIE